MELMKQHHYHIILKQFSIFLLNTMYEVNHIVERIKSHIAEKKINFGSFYPFIRKRTGIIVLGANILGGFCGLLGSRLVW